jgi:GT2 family glycosyltransferase
VSAPLLSVIVPTHDNLSVLQQCVASWRIHGGDAFELLVVEDGCRDGTAAWLEQLGASPWGTRHVRVFHEDDVHEQRCTNRGLAEARAPLLLVWQDDMFVARSWFAGELLRTFGSHDDLGLLGLTRGLDCHPVGKPIERWEDLTDWDRLTSTIGSAPLNWLRIQEVDFVIRPWVVRRDAIARVGALDTAFALSEWDEADLCFRIRQAGWRVGTHGYERAGAYVHLGSTTLGRSFSEAYKAQVLRNGLLFHERWDLEIARNHRRNRRAWWRRPSAAALRDTAQAMGRRFVERRRARTEFRPPEPAGEARRTR